MVSFPLSHQFLWVCHLLRRVWLRTLPSVSGFMVTVWMSLLTICAANSINQCCSHSERICLLVLSFQFSLFLPHLCLPPQLPSCVWCAPNCLLVYFVIFWTVQTARGSCLLRLWHIRFEATCLGHLDAERGVAVDWSPPDSNPSW